MDERANPVSWEMQVLESHISESDLPWLLQEVDKWFRATQTARSKEISMGHELSRANHEIRRRDAKLKRRDARIRALLRQIAKLKKHFNPEGESRAMTGG